MSRADLDKQPGAVAAMFDQVARRYDLLNDLSSLGFDRSWRKAVVRAVGAEPGQALLDLASGTGTSAIPFADGGAKVVCCDFSLGMLSVGKERRPDLNFVAGDGMRLPFADASFDAVTISFGLRNVSDPTVVLSEMARVTKPGGRMVVCEFSTPTWEPFRTIYQQYLIRMLPIAARVSSNPVAYEYLAESIRDWPDQKDLGTMILRAGWARVEYRNLTSGIVALHRATKSR